MEIITFLLDLIFGSSDKEEVKKESIVEDGYVKYSDGSSRKIWYENGSDPYPY